mgnify:CR=1 FL=1
MFGWKGWIKENAQYIDTVVLSRPHISKKYIDFIKQNTNAKIVYYVHDLHFLREFREYELTKNPKLKASSDYWKKVELDLILLNYLLYLLVKNSLTFSFENYPYPLD